MRMQLILVIAFTAIGLLLCSFSYADTLMKNVGEDFGKSWLTQNSNKFAAITSNSSKTSGNREARPLGYEVSNGEIYPKIAPTEWYYPMFLSNSTPILINGTSFSPESELRSTGIRSERLCR